MKKIYLFLTALIVSLSAWGYGSYSGYYLNVPGGHNNWGDNGVNFNNAGYAANTISDLASNEFKLKIWNGDNQWRGNGNKSLSTRKWYSITGNGDNMQVSGGKGGYKVEYNWDSQQMRITPSTYSPNYSTWAVNLYGAFNSYDDYTGGVSPTNNVVTFKDVAIGDGYFGIKVWDGTDDTHYVYTTEKVPVGSSATLYPYGNSQPKDNQKMKISGATSGKKYDVTFNVSTGQITISEATAVPTLTVNTPTVNNVSYTTATLNWGYTASNMSSEKFNVTYNLKSNGASVQTGSLLSNGTTTSGTYSLTNLNEGTAYTVDVTVAPVGGTVAAQTKTSATFTTSSHPTLYLCYTQSGSWGSNNPPSYFAEATQSNGIYKWSVTLAPGDYFFVSEKTGGWNDISSSRWGPSTGKTYDVTGGDEDWNKNINLAKNTESFQMKSEVTTGTYQITVDYTGSTPKLTISKGEAINGNLSDPEIVRSDAKYNTSDTKKEFAFYTITITNIPSGANVYYTLDGTDPNSSSLRYREGHPFQASANSTVKALAIKGSDTSKIVEKDVTDNADVNYAWEKVSDAERMHRLRVFVNVDSYKGANAILTVDLTDNSNATEGNIASPFSWAKYEDFAAFDELNAKTSDDLENLTDHASSDGGMLDANGWHDLEHNDTDTHVARNFTPAFYRAYVHSDNMPTNANTNAASVLSLRTYADNDAWVTNDNPAAGQVDPFATARVAYTTLVNVDNDPTTGVEDVVVDDTIANDNDAPVVYYNLNGVRVEKPSNGIFIRVQGKKVEKIMVR